MDIQRTLLLLLAIVFLILGVALYLQGTTQSNQYSGILIRVGVMLGVVWTAYPQLETLRRKSSVFVISVLLGLMLIVAARPRIFPIAAAVAIATILINGVMRRFAGVNIQRGNKKHSHKRPQDHRPRKPS